MPRCKIPPRGTGGECELVVSEEECAREEMAAIPKGRLKQHWDMNATFDSGRIPKTWKRGGKNRYGHDLYKATVNTTIENVWERKEKVNAKITFSVMRTSSGPMVTGADVDMNHTLDSLDSGVQMFTELFDRISEDADFACWDRGE